MNNSDQGDGSDDDMMDFLHFVFVQTFPRVPNKHMLNKRTYGQTATVAKEYAPFARTDLECGSSIPWWRSEIVLSK